MNTVELIIYVVIVALASKHHLPAGMPRCRQIELHGNAYFTRGCDWNFNGPWHSDSVISLR